VSQLPVPYVPRALAARSGALVLRAVRRLAAAPVSEWGALFGVALAALTAAVAIAVIAVHTWRLT
jgi:hypothetical protein